MKCLEFILVRTAGPCEQQAKKHMRRFCRIIKKYNLSKANLYIHASIPGDLALLISSNAQEDKHKGTYWGIYMADVLKQFGLVDYNCWLLDKHEKTTNNNRH